MQKLTVHRVGVSSLGKLIGAWQAIIGLVIGVFGAVVTNVNIFEENDFGLLAGIGIAILVVLGWLIVYPLLMFVIGWIQGVILGLIFNLVVSGSGGLSLEVEEKDLTVSTKK